jgi:hypothetical protein
LFEKYNNINKSGYNTCRDEHKQDIQTGTALYSIREEKYRTAKEKVEEPTSP